MIRRLLIALVLTVVLRVEAASTTWINGGNNLFWSNPLNWNGGLPNAGLQVDFLPASGATNAPGLVNSILDADITVTNVFFNATNPYYHTLLINPGKTLSLQSPAWVTADKFTVRLTSPIPSNTAYLTVRGAGRVIVGDTNNPSNNGDTMRVHAIAPNNSATELGPHWATLDLSGLDYFAYALGSIKIGGVGASSGGAHGTLRLAKTNLIICGDTSSTATLGLFIGNGTATTAGNLDSAGDLQLGQENVLRLHNLKVGGGRSALGTMEFQTNQVNPVLRLRGVDGVSPANTISIGDNFDAPNSTSFNNSVSAGILDLSGGNVDVLVNNLHVGRNLNTTTTSRNVGGNGTLTWTAGTINASILNVGLQSANNAGSVVGVVNVLSNAALVAGTITLGGDSGAATGTGSGMLNVASGGMVTVTGNLAESNADGVNGSSTINLSNGTINVAGNITADTLNYSGGSVACGGVLGLTSLAVRPPATSFTLSSGQQVAPVGVGSAGTLAVTGDLILGNATLRFDLSSAPASKDLVAVTGQLNLVGSNLVDLNLIAPLTNGNYLVATFGSLAGGVTGLRVSGPAVDGPNAFAFTNTGGSLWIQVSSNTVTVDTNLLVRLVGEAVEVSWSKALTGWVLECQTNSLAVGLSTNWFPVPGAMLTNRLALPLDPAAGAVFYRLAYSPSIKKLRKIAANRPRRIIFNNDGGEPARSMTEPTAQNLLQLRTLGLVGTHVDTITYTPRSSGFGLFTYFTKIGAIFTSTNASYGNNMMGPLLAAGIDPLRVMNEFAHSNHIEFFCTFRMNDTHDGASGADAPVIFAANPLKVNHPEYLLGSASSPPTYGEWTAVNYARPEIRDLAVRFAEEVCTNYNLDGIEFDFLRHPVFFPSTASGQVATVAERNAMTDLMQRIRIMADNVGRARGRPILISMRVPDSVSYSRAIGVELDTWLANDLLDILVVSSYFKLNDWDYSVALAHQYGVKIYPSLDESRISDATAQALRMTDLAYRSRAANVWGFGCDGVYMFNFFDPNSALWQQLGDPQVLAGLDKDYFGSIRGVVNSAGGNLPYTSYQTVEKLNPSNTKTITPGNSAVTRINVGEDLTQAGPVNLKFRLQFTTAVNPAVLTVTCNSQPLSLAGTNQLWVEYSAPTTVVQQVTNHVRVTLSPSASQVIWRDLMLQVRH